MTPPGGRAPLGAARLAGGVDDTPPVTRGVSLQLVHQEREPFGVHWLRGTSDVHHLELLFYLLDQVGLTAPTNAAGLHGWRKGLRFAEGVRFCWDPRPATDGDRMPQCFVEVNGEACEALGWDRLQLVALCLNLTRVDLAWDAGDLTPRILDRWWEVGCGRSRIRYTDWKRNQEGRTWTLGKQGSTTAQLQCYDRRGYNRLELRLFKGRAQAFHEAGGFTSDAAACSLTALAFLRRVVDFVDPHSDSNITRRTLLPSWEAFLDGAARSDVALPPRPPSSDASHRRWVRQIAKSLGRALLRDGYSDLLRVAEHGADLLDPDLAETRRRRLAERPSSARSVALSAPSRPSTAVRPPS